MRNFRVLWLWALASGVVVLSNEAVAQSTVISRSANEAPGPTGDALGGYTVEVTCPVNRTVVLLQSAPPVQRTVRLWASRPAPGYRAITDDLLRSVPVLAQYMCPMFSANPLQQPQPDLSVGAFELFAPPEVGARPALVFRADRFRPQSNAWDSVNDVLASTASPPQQAAQEAAPPPVAAVPPPAPVHKLSKAQMRAQRRAALREAAAARALQTEQARQVVAADARLQAESRAFLAVVCKLVALAFLLLMVWLIFKNRVAILRWYYFHFDRHPADLMIRAAIRSPERPLADPDALANALGELPPRGVVLRRVRLEQAEQLYGELRTASLARQQAYAERAKQNASLLREEEAFIGMQQALGLVAIALENAKVAYNSAQNLKLSGALL